MLLKKMLLALAVALLSASAAIAAPVMLVDQGHGQRFVIEKEEALQLSSFASVMKQEGFEVRSGSEPLTDDSLKGVSVLVISGPFVALLPSEVEAVTRFIGQGGRMVTMLHIGSPLAGLLHRLEVDFSNYSLREQENVIDNDSRNFRAKAFESSPLFDGLSHFSAYGVWALMNTAANARIIASTSSRAWVDLDSDNKLTTADAVQQFGILVEGTQGAGRFLVFGDDAIFQNKFLDDNNRKLATNMARWLK